MKKVNYYSDIFRQTVVNEILNGSLNKEAARRKYGIKGKSAILNWMRKFDTSNTYPVMAKKNQDNTEKTKQQLEAENAKLRKELDLEQLRNKALNVMIDIAEDQFKIPIRKKSGAKRSKK